MRTWATAAIVMILLTSAMPIPPVVAEQESPGFTETDVRALEKEIEEKASMDVDFSVTLQFKKKVGLEISYNPKDGVKARLQIDARRCVSVVRVAEVLLSGGLSAAVQEAVQRMAKGDTPEVVDILACGSAKLDLNVKPGDRAPSRASAGFELKAGAFLGGSVFSGKGLVNGELTMGGRARVDVALGNAADKVCQDGRKVHLAYLDLGLSVDAGPKAFFKIKTPPGPWEAREFKVQPNLKPLFTWTHGWRWLYDPCTGDVSVQASSNQLAPGELLLREWSKDGTLAALGFAGDAPPGTPIDLSQPLARETLGLGSASAQEAGASSTGEPCDADQSVEAPGVPALSTGPTRVVRIVLDCDATNPASSSADVIASKGVVEPSLPVLGTRDVSDKLREVQDQAPVLRTVPFAWQAAALALEPNDRNREAFTAETQSMLDAVHELFGTTNYTAPDVWACELAQSAARQPFCDEEVVGLDPPRVALQGNELALWQFDRSDIHRLLDQTKPVYDASPLKRDGRVEGATISKGRFRDAYFFDGRGDGQGARLAFDIAPVPAGEFTALLWLKPACALGQCAGSQTIADWGAAGSLRMLGSSLVATRSGVANLVVPLEGCWVPGAWSLLIWSVAGGVESLMLGNCKAARPAASSVGSAGALSLGASLARTDGFHGALDEVIVWSGRPAEAVNSVVVGLQAYRPSLPALKRVTAGAARTAADPGAPLDAVRVDIPTPPWDATGVSAFRIYRSATAGDFGAVVQQIPAPRDATGQLQPAVWVDANVVYGQRYYYRATAVTPGGESEITPPIEVTAGFAKRALPRLGQRAEPVEETLAPAYVSKDASGLRAPPLEIKTYSTSPTEYCAEFLLFGSSFGPAVCRSPGSHPVKLAMDKIPDQTWQPIVQASGEPRIRSELFYQYDPTRVDRTRVPVTAFGEPLAEATVALPIPPEEDDLAWLLAHPDQTALVIRVAVEDESDPSRNQNLELGVPYVGQLLAAKDETVVESVLLDDAVGAISAALDDLKQFAIDQPNTADSAVVANFAFEDAFAGPDLDASKWVPNAVNSITHIVNGGFQFEDATLGTWIYGGSDAGSQHQARWTPTYDFRIQWTSTITDTAPAQAGQGGVALVAADNTVIYYLHHADGGGLVTPFRAVVDENNIPQSFAYRLDVGSGDTARYAIVRHGNTYEAWINELLVDTFSTATPVAKVALAAGAGWGSPFLDAVRISNLEIRSPAFHATYAASAVWDQRSNVAYVFGGITRQGTTSPDIVRFDPVARTALVEPTALPTPRYGTSAVWDGNYAYIFGGNNGGVGTSREEIVRYDPLTKVATVMGARLPTGRFGSSAVWDPTNKVAYVFGGYGQGGATNQILRYDPATDRVTAMAATLPTARYQTSAVWDPTSNAALVFGGYALVPSPAISYSSPEIVRFQPALDTAVVEPASLPSGRHGTSAAWDGQYAYVFGGYNGNAGANTYLDEIVRYHPLSKAVTTMHATLPTARYATSAVWDPNSRVAYVVGGSGPSGVVHEVIRYTPAPSLVAGQAERIFATLAQIQALAESLPGVVAQKAVETAAQRCVGGRAAGTAVPCSIAANGAPVWFAGIVDTRYIGMSFWYPCIPVYGCCSYAAYPIIGCPGVVPYVNLIPPGGLVVHSSSRGVLTVCAPYWVSQAAMLSCGPYATLPGETLWAVPANDGLDYVIVGSTA